MSKKANLMKTIGLASAIAVGGASCDIIKNTQGELRGDLARSGRHYNESKEIEKTKIEKIIHRMVNDYKHQYYKSEQKKRFSPQEYERILREVILSAENLVAYNNLGLVELCNNKFQLADIKDKDELDALNLSNWGLLKESQRDTFIADFYIKKYSFNQEYDKSLYPGIPTLNYPLENDLKKIQKYVGKLGYKFSRKLLFFWQVDTNFTRMNPPEYLFFSWIDVPEKKPETTGWKYKEPKKDTVFVISQEKIKEEEKKMNEIFNYGQKIIFKPNVADFKKGVENDLNVVAAILKNNPILNVTLIGYHGGGRKTISLARAEAVKKYLTRKGIDSDRIQTIGSEHRIACSIEIRINNEGEKEKQESEKITEKSDKENRSEKEEKKIEKEIPNKIPIISDANEIKKRNKELQAKKTVRGTDDKDFKNNINKIAESHDGTMIISVQTGRSFIKIGDKVYYNTEGMKAENEIWGEISDSEDSYLRLGDKTFVKITGVNTRTAPDGQGYVNYQGKRYNDKGEEMEEVK